MIVSRYFAWSLPAACLAIASFSSPATAQEDRTEARIALIVGNTDYEVLDDLPNARRDAELVSRYFAELGYRTVTVEDASLSALQDAVSDVAAMTVEDASVAFYYAGHGLQVGAGNYLLPVDAQISGLHDLPFAALSLGHIMSILSARADTAFFILDSCRDNPFLATMVTDSLEGEPKPIEAGFYFQRSPIDTFVAFSTSPGELASDGPQGGNSPFTQAFVANARGNPGAQMSTLMARTRRDVYLATDGRQLPWESSSLTAPGVLGEALQASVMVPELQPLAEGVTRGPAEATEAQSGGATTQEPALQRVYITDSFEREVPIGQRISGAAGLNDMPALRLARTPKRGNIAFVRGGRLSALAEGDIVPAGALDTLRFLPNVQRFSSAGLESLERDASFLLQGGGQEIEIELRLAFDRCDLAAGGVLDPGGVGAEVYRYELRPRAALAACRAAAEREPDNPRFRYQYGRALMAIAELEAAREELLAAAERGYVRAAQRLGLLALSVYLEREGLSDRPLPEEAVAFMERGVSLGDPLADYTLGRDLLRYGDTATQRERGYALLIRAYSAGYLEAINELGRYFLTADDEHFDRDRGMRYFEATAERGNIAGLYSLGLIYRRGVGGVTPDSARAIAYLESAAEGGHPAAPNILGIMYETGEGVAADAAQAVEFYRLALERGSPWGGANAASVIVQQAPDGYTDVDAAILAGLAAAFQNSDAAERARGVLARLSDRALTAAAQNLLNELGAELVVDGRFGPASVAALAEQLGRAAAALSSEAPHELLIAIAREHWARTGFRVDML